ARYGRGERIPLANWEMEPSPPARHQYRSSKTPPQPLRSFQTRGASRSCSKSINTPSRKGNSHEDDMSYLSVVGAHDARHDGDRLRSTPGFRKGPGANPAMPGGARRPA